MAQSVEVQLKQHKLLLAPITVPMQIVIGTHNRASQMLIILLIKENS